MALCGESFLSADDIKATKKDIVDFRRRGKNNPHCSLDILLRLIDKKKIGLDDVRAEVS